MAFQRGSLKRVERKQGETWMLRYRVSTADGRRVEHGLLVGLLRDLPTEKSAWLEVAKQGLHVRINEEISTGRIKFSTLAEHYLKTDFGEDAVRPRSENTIPIVEHYVRDYLIKRWGDEFADDIRPLDIQRWLKSLHDSKVLAWSTVSKIRGLMLRIYRIGLIHELVTKNPVEHVETRAKSDYKPIVLTPKDTFAILGHLDNPLHRALVFTCAATALCASELLSLRWNDVLWDEEKIRVSKRWAKGKDGKTKTEASEGHVPMHPILLAQMMVWHEETAYAKETDFVFPSLKAEGKLPLSGCIFVADHLRTAAIAAGVVVAEGQRFGLHNLRHSLSNWLVNKAKVDPKTAQSMLRHANVKTTLQLYVHNDGDETKAAQGRFLTEMIQ
jgi:integrase